jgi:hypothetical protein
MLLIESTTSGPAGYTFCAEENGNCSFSGTASVAYGANGAFAYKTYSNGASCNNATFGDPILGTGKSCYYKSTGVTFYQDINYGGAFTDTKGPGDYAALPGGVPNDWMSSLRVPSGWSITTYSDGNFGGTTCTFTADTAWVGTACNDVMSSFKIRGPVGVTFYQDANFSGLTSGLKAKGDYGSLPADVPNDWMSSLRVPAGWIVDTYADSNFTGAICTFTADTGFVGATCNDKMSSFRIR